MTKELSLLSFQDKIIELQQRTDKNPKNDVYYTPKSLCIDHIEELGLLAHRFFSWEEKIRIYDPFAGKHIYRECIEENKLFNYFARYEIIESEIEEGMDFFKYNENVDIIVSNPPYSKLTEIFKHAITLKPKIISFLLGMMNVTPARINFMKKHNYQLHSMNMTRVKNWFTYSAILTFVKTENISNQLIFKTDDKWHIDPNRGKKDTTNSSDISKKSKSKSV